MLEIVPRLTKAEYDIGKVTHEKSLCRFRTNSLPRAAQ